ncbi:MAG: hypothetical protein A2Z78_02070 [Candidatus Nealsonbacteria bacterium RBG_13_36_15]|uniref:Proline--tRNA ligase n=1 Tax=Candidatus Nealsonbacteria bacterium RBG_13_36_15 TaxID=1801660 RepID=A0A1G2DUV4_9BACT|nr:MAG: hypothetical protein A2Z78_02070 [Candidatus Nealsonbacteria bacterium RBG_13_36_15]
MRQSELFTKTIKEAPKDEKSINAQLLFRAGFVHKEMAGVYTFLPLGNRVLKNIENIIREEMNKIGGQEILMPVLQPKYLWEKTDRWSKGVGKVMYKTKDDSGKEFGLGPTHEEILTNIASKYIKSYSDLPAYIYQIQTKFRKEPRARSGLLRGREFGMKDLYSFHSSEEDFKNYYEIVKKAYFKIFKRCELSVIITEASGAGFTKEYTHEFQVLAKDGEDSIIYCPRFHFAQNKEIAKFKNDSLCPACKKTIQEGRSIEVGNIFPLGTKYSKDLNAYFIDKDGKRKLIIMGCYGIGSSRIMGAIVEVHHDDKGIIWPEEIAPFKVHLIPVEDNQKVIKTTENLYQDLQKQKIEVLYDDRKKRGAGEKFVESDLIGIPFRLVISQKTLSQKKIEVKKRKEKKIELLRVSSLYKFLKS